MEVKYKNQAAALEDLDRGDGRSEDVITVCLGAVEGTGRAHRPLEAARQVGCENRVIGLVQGKATDSRGET